MSDENSEIHIRGLDDLDLLQSSLERRTNHLKRINLAVWISLCVYGVAVVLEFLLCITALCGIPSIYDFVIFAGMLYLLLLLYAAGIRLDVLRTLCDINNIMILNTVKVMVKNKKREVGGHARKDRRAKAQ